MPSTSMLRCRNNGTYQCSHCDVFFCLQHGLRHQEELKSEIRVLLTKTQVEFLFSKGKNQCEMVFFSRNYLTMPKN